MVCIARERRARNVRGGTLNGHEKGARSAAIVMACKVKCVRVIQWSSLYSGCKFGPEWTAVQRVYCIKRSPLEHRPAHTRTRSVTLHTSLLAQWLSMCGLVYRAVAVCGLDYAGPCKAMLTSASVRSLNECAQEARQALGVSTVSIVQIMQLSVRTHEKVCNAAITASKILGF